MAAVLLLALLVTAVPAAADTTGYYTNPSPPDNPTCPTGTYTVPNGTRYVQITAYGGAGAAGSTKVLFDGLNPGLGGTGAVVQAIFPVTAGQTFSVVVGRKGAWNAQDVETTYSGWPDGGQNPTNNGGGGGSSFVTTQKLVAYTGCQDGTKDPLDPNKVMNLDRSQMLIVAGGGGGGGNAGSVRSGGNGGDAGARADFFGATGSDGNHGDIDPCYGRGGGGASVTAAGGGGGACSTGSSGQGGHGFYGGGSPLFGIGPFTMRVGASGAGGGGYYGGGSGSEADAFLGGGGGGAGSSYVRPGARRASVHQAVDDPQVYIEPLDTPTTTASGDLAGTPLADWYTAAPSIWFRAQGGMTGGKTYYALDNPGCSATNLAACTVYSGAFSVGKGLHTLTYFSIDGWGLDELVHTKSFAVTPTSAGVNTASIASGTNPAAAAGGAAGAAGSISVSAAGSGVVGAAVYTANPAGAPVFNSSGAYVDVTVAGSGLSSATIKDCDLNGGTNVYWNTGTGWALVSNQTYDPSTHCVTVTVNSTTVPTLSQLAGTPFAAGSPPSSTAVAKTADGKPYTSGTWTNQSVTVAFTCSANATPTNPITRASDGQNQSASGTCTDGLGQKATTTFTGINVDKTAPTITAVGTPTSIWPPNHKLVDVNIAASLADTLSGPDGFVLLSATASGDPTDIQGFVVGAASTSGQLRANKDEVYTLTYQGKDKAGNTATAVVTIAVTHK